MATSVSCGLTRLSAECPVTPVLPARTRNPREKNTSGTREKSFEKKLWFRELFSKVTKTEPSCVCVTKKRRICKRFAAESLVLCRQWPAATQRAPSLQRQLLLGGASKLIPSLLQKSSLTGGKTCFHIEQKGVTWVPHQKTTWYTKHPLCFTRFKVTTCFVTGRIKTERRTGFPCNTRCFCVFEPTKSWIQIAVGEIRITTTVLTPKPNAKKLIKFKCHGWHIYRAHPAYVYLWCSYVRQKLKMGEIC